MTPENDPLLATPQNLPEPAEIKTQPRDLSLDQFAAKQRMKTQYDEFLRRRYFR